MVASSNYLTSTHTHITSAMMFRPLQYFEVRLYDRLVVSVFEWNSDYYFVIIVSEHMLHSEEEKGSQSYVCVTTIVSLDDQFTI